MMTLLEILMRIVRLQMMKVLELVTTIAEQEMKLRLQQVMK